jgi:hypothetical protein
MDKMNSASCTSLYFKNCGFKALFNPHTRTQKFFRGTLPEQELPLASTPGVRNTNHEPLHLATISFSCQEMSLHIQLVQVGSKRNSLMQDITLGKKVRYSVVANIFFPI